MKVLHYSYDDHGMENLQQTLAIAEEVAFEFPEVAQLVVTKSHHPDDVRLPKKADFTKVPSRDECSKAEDQGLSPSLPCRVIKSLCKTFIFDAIRCFKADVVVVQAPQNVQSDVLYGLNHLQKRSIKTKIVLGNGDLENTAMMIRDVLVETVSAQTSFLSTVNNYSEEGQYPQKRRQAGKSFQETGQGVN